MSQPAEISNEELLARVQLSALAREVTTLKPAGREKQGLCPFHKESTPSFYVNDEKGVFKCYGCDAQGGVLDFVARLERTDKRGARKWLLERLSLAERGEVAPRRKPLPVRREGESHKRGAAIGWARKHWDESHPAGCTDVELYLAGRGIDVRLIDGVPPSVRYHRALFHSESGRKLPAMVCAIQMPDRRVCGIHRTFLQKVTADEAPEAARAMERLGLPTKYGVVVKARVKAAKKMAGVSKGGAIRLAPVGEKLIIAEGIETAFSVMPALKLPAWAAMSLTNLAEQVIPPEVQEVLLCADGDNKDKEAAERQLQLAVRAYQKQGVNVRVMRAPDGMDFNDVLLHGHQMQTP